ncbi:MAG: ribonuclease D [Actinomycetota bacterium]|nr:ribonuclease D [Actinomycetota bacterium]MDA2994610.1 ribonuclease D [Actinomycetota bacterium]
MSDSDDIEFTWVDSTSVFADIVKELLACDRYAIDTEFHRERTYFPALALVQLGWGEGNIALVDPLAVDLAPLKELFESDVKAVFHAAQQDLDVLTHAVGSIPRQLFDTQVAGGFVGYGTPSLASLVNSELKISLAKGDRLTDWLRRPLTDAQKRYAAIDVAYLIEIQDRLLVKLAETGRTEWVTAACEELRKKGQTPVRPEDAWLRLKDARGLNGKGRGVARAVSQWRERRAMELDVPVRQVLPDLAILGIAQRQPKNETELSQARGVDGRAQRGSTASEILAAVAEGLAGPVPEVPSGGDDIERDLRPAVTLISAWVSQVANSEGVDTAMLATRADLVALLSGDPTARLASGWRAELLGDDIQALVSGNASLTFVPSEHSRPAGLRLLRSDQIQ